MRNPIRLLATPLAFALLSAGSKASAQADFTFFGRSGDGVLLDFAAQPGVGASASFSNVTVFGPHAALTSDTLGGQSFATAGRLHVFAKPDMGPGRGGDQDLATPGFQGTLRGTVDIDGQTKSFDVVVRPGFSGVGRGAVGQSLEGLGRINNPLFVAQQQHRLAYFGYHRNGGGLPAVTGSFDTATDQALRTFQGTFVAGNNTTQANVDGIIGPNTAGWLNAANAPFWEELIDPNPQVPGTFSVGSMLGDFDILPARDPGTNIRSGLTPQTERFGSSWSIDLIEHASANAKAITGRTQLVNAISTFDGYGSACCHSTHRVGSDIDLHVDVSTWNFGNGILDGEELKVVQHARAFLNLNPALAGNARVNRILTSNGDILDAINATHPGRAVFDSSGVHLNHLHLDIVAGSRIADTPELLGDFDLTDAVDQDDIDRLFRNLGGDASIYSLDGNQTVTLTDVDVLVTDLLGSLYGDANLNGTIEQGDLDAVLNNWGAPNRGWATGDFNGDRFVDQADLDRVLNGWGSASSPNFRGVAVPEPVVAGVWLALCAAAARPRPGRAPATRNREGVAKP